MKESSFRLSHKSGLDSRTVCLYQQQFFNTNETCGLQQSAQSLIDIRDYIYFNHNGPKYK